MITETIADDGLSDPVLKCPFGKITDRTKIIGLPSITDEQIYVVRVKRIGNAGPQNSPLLGRSESSDTFIYVPWNIEFF
jgi:hypothetical protein